jgi:hypothetical protein
MSLASCDVCAFDRQNTDVVTLRNGDRVTGEIDSLKFGVLRFKTSDMGTIDIEWPAVKGVDSRYSFYIETLDGLHHYGTLQASARNDEVLINEGAASVSVPISALTRVSQVERSFWRRFSGSLSVGYSFTKSTDISTTSASFNTTYISSRVESIVSASMMTTKSPDRGTVDRDYLASTVRFRRPGANFWQLLSSLERNEEIGIDGRLQLGAAVGRHFVQHRDSELTGFAGMAFTQEWANNTSESQQSAEGVLGGQWSIFRFGDPQTSLSSSLMIFPSLTESGRYRSSVDITLSLELVEDLTLDFSLYDSYDNEPPEEGAEKRDYGIVTALGYKF